MKTLMEEAERREALKFLIACLQKKTGGSVPKIAIQKFVYFLRELGVPFPYHYKQYDFGPYSRELKEELDDMVFWDEIRQDSSYEYSCLEEVDVENLLRDPELRGRLLDDIKRILKTLDNDLSFNTLELFGTVLFCLKTMELFGEEITEESLIEDVKSWKADKFRDAEIKNAYEKCRELFINEEHVH